jgi:hypothetical protein
MKRIKVALFKYIILFIISGSAIQLHAQQKTADTHYEDKGYQIGVYYFPNYHFDKRNEKYFGKGWTEWKLIKEAKPRFAGHQQPKVPLWGYTDEADPKQMAQKIEAASSHGITAFIFDWYYYNDGPFLETGLEDGFMKAKNNKLMKFSLMWANHDWTDIHPYTLGAPQKLLYHGAVTPETWDKMTDYIIVKYFKHPSYWLIDGAPYFSIYDLGSFVKSFGTVEAAAKALADFRKKTKAAGFTGLHLNVVVAGKIILPSEKVVQDPVKTVQQLHFNSVTDYVWVHHVGLNSFPSNPYDSVKNAYLKYADSARTKFSIPYFPNVSMGWDPTPRTNQNLKWVSSRYPYTPVIVGNTPAAFKRALIQVKEFADRTLKTNKIITINSWNEWTEGSYLEPDTKNKLQYLDAIKSVFGKRD